MSKATTVCGLGLAAGSRISSLICRKTSCVERRGRNPNIVSVKTPLSSRYGCNLFSITCSINLPIQDVREIGLRFSISGLFPGFGISVISACFHSFGNSPLLHTWFMYSVSL
uniref:Uncharacterized protein n=1 Tax=Ixodes ricinus TaxID=34613 RepID=A0A6B0UJR3_IXORI